MASFYPGTTEECTVNNFNDFFFQWDIFYFLGGNFCEGKYNLIYEKMTSSHGAIPVEINLGRIFFRGILYARHRCTVNNFDDFFLMGPFLKEN